MNKSYTKNNDLLRSISFFIASIIPIKWMALLIYNDFFIKNPVFILLIFGPIWWIVSLYIFYVLMKSFPFNYFPDPYISLPFKFKVSYGFKAKLFAFFYFVLFLLSTLIPLGVYGYYSGMNELLYSIDESHKDYHATLGPMKPAAIEPTKNGNRIVTDDKQDRLLRIDGVIH